MLVNSRGKPVFTIVVVARPHDCSLKARVNSTFSVLLPGLDVVLLNAGCSETTKWKEYARLYPNFRYAETNATSELSLFLEAVSLCRGKYLHVSLPGRYLPPTFFKTAVHLMEDDDRSNLVYAGPEEITCSSLTTANYTKGSRIAINLYLATQVNFQLDGVIRFSELQLNCLRLNDNTWRSSIVVDLACRGVSHDLRHFRLRVDKSLAGDLPTQIDFALLTNEIQSIWKHVDSIRDKCFLILSALSNAIFATRCEEPDMLIWWRQNEPQKAAKQH